MIHEKKIIALIDDVVDGIVSRFIRHSMMKALGARSSHDSYLEMESTSEGRACADELARQMFSKRPDLIKQIFEHYFAPVADPARLTSLNEKVVNVLLRRHGDDYDVRERALKIVRRIAERDAQRDFVRIIECCDQIVNLPSTELDRFIAESVRSPVPTGKHAVQTDLTGTESDLEWYDR